MNRDLSDPALRAVAGERLADVAVARLRAGHADPDMVLDALLAAFALDGHAVGGPALRAAARRVQKAIEIST